MHDGRSILAACDALAALSADGERLTRCYLTPEHARANALVAEWMRAAGMTTWQDSVASQWGRYAGEDPDAPALVIGSHLDTVVDAGRYDGMLGVVMGIALVSRLKASGRRLRHPIEVVAFGDEEGTRFGTALFGSRAMADQWDPAWWELTDADGVTLAEAFRAFGLDPARVRDAARAPHELAGYLEAHIEQGPVLEAEQRACGVVTGIAGARRFAIGVDGHAGHAGTTPFALRRDALAGAAEAVVAIERIARDAGVVATVGRLETHPGAVNVIPGRVTMTLDIRAERDAERDAALDSIRRACDAIGDARRLHWQWQETHSAPATACSPRLTDALTRAVSTEEAPAVCLPSGAGHDGMAVADVTEIGMLFVRCRGGISHHPDESVEAADIDAALDALGEAVDRLDREPLERDRRSPEPGSALDA